MRSFLASLRQRHSWRAMWFLIQLDLRMWFRLSWVGKAGFVAILAAATSLGVSFGDSLPLDALAMKMETLKKATWRATVGGVTSGMASLTAESAEQKKADLDAVYTQLDNSLGAHGMKSLGAFRGIFPSADALKKLAEPEKKSKFRIYEQALTPEESGALRKLGGDVFEWKGETPVAKPSDDDQPTIWVKPDEDRDAADRVIWDIYQSPTNAMMFLAPFDASPRTLFLQTIGAESKQQLAQLLDEKGVPEEALLPRVYAFRITVSAARGAPALLVQNALLLFMLFALPGASAMLSSLDWVMTRQAGSFLPWVSSPEPAWVIAGRWIFTRAIKQGSLALAAAFAVAVFALCKTGHIPPLLLAVPELVFAATFAWNAIALFEDNLFHKPWIRFFVGGLGPVADLILVRPFYLNARENLLHPPVLLFGSLCVGMGLFFWFLAAWRIGNGERLSLRPIVPKSR